MSPFPELCAATIIITELINILRLESILQTPLILTLMGCRMGVLCVSCVCELCV